MEVAEAWEIAHAFDQFAISAVPTLEQLIGQYETWPDPSLRVDVAEWLDAHLNSEQLGELDEIAGYPPRDTEAPWYDVGPIGEDLTWALTPPDLLTAWRRVVGPAESDFTDKEWNCSFRCCRPSSINTAASVLAPRANCCLCVVPSMARGTFAYDLHWSGVKL